MPDLTLILPDLSLDLPGSPLDLPDSSLGLPDSPLGLPDLPLGLQKLKVNLPDLPLGLPDLLLGLSDLLLGLSELMVIPPELTLVFAADSPSPGRPFLRRQESHRHGRHRRLNYAAVGAHNCEIPAYAGMVCGGTGNRGRILPIFAHDTVRFLPTQEWSAWERGIGGRILLLF